MPYYVRVRGVEVRCDTESELDALIDRASANSRSSDGAAQGDLELAQSAPPTDLRKHDLAARSLRFLEAVRDAGPGGIGGEKLVKKVGCEKRESLGRAVSVAKRLLAESGIDWEGVVGKKRVGQDKVWVGESKLGDAIEALQEMGKQSA
jgi:hypothetical protein